MNTNERTMRSRSSLASAAAILLNVRLPAAMVMDRGVAKCASSRGGFVSGTF